MKRLKPSRAREAAKESRARRAENRPGFVRLLVVESRLGLVLLPQLLYNALVPDHDADAFKGVEVVPRSTADRLAERLLSGLGRWDARHFLHVAQFGYTLETNLAFQPLFPLLVRVVTSAWVGLAPSLQPHYALLLSAVLINLGAFLAAGYFLYQLSLRALGRQRDAYAALLLFAANPASVFFSAAYSEALFAALTFLGLDLLTRRAGPLRAADALASAAVLGLATLTRANGLLNLGFLVWALGFPFLAHLLRLHPEPRGRLKALVCLPLLGLVCLVTFLAPWAYHQWAIFRDFCGSGGAELGPGLRRLGRDLGLPMPGDVDRMPWCNRTLPLSYAYVQAAYWDVGPLGYFQLRKLPCFLLAAPAVLTALYAVLHFDAVGRAVRRPWAETLSDRSLLLPLTLHCVVLTLTTTVLGNVEVTTRVLLCSSPLPYWALASLLPTEALGAEAVGSGSLWRGLWAVWGGADERWPWARPVLLYALLYATLGTALHVNFLPWT